MLTSRGLEMPLYLWRQEWHKREKVKFLDSTQVLHRRGSRINTDRFPKRAPEVKACKLVWIREWRQVKHLYTVIASCEQRHQLKAWVKQMQCSV